LGGGEIGNCSSKVFTIFGVIRQFIIEVNNLKIKFAVQDTFGGLLFVNFFIKNNKYENE
jgi:hypothetical protein